jgi:hypothetical protein
MKPRYRLPDELPWWHEFGRVALFALILAVLIFAFMGIGR